MSFIDGLKEKISGKGMRIVFPEGGDPRIVWAAAKHKEDGFIEPIVLGKKEEIEKAAKEAGVDCSDLTIIEPGTFEDEDKLVSEFVARRKGKIDEDGARQQMIDDANYLGTMLVYCDYADGMVSGAVGTTGNTVLPALQIVKTKEGIKRVSGLFIMLRDDDIYFMADCAINLTVDTETLAEIAYATYLTAEQFGLDPKVAMLSFSTKGSASSDDVDKVSDATEIVKKEHPEIAIDGELQFDAALVPEIGNKKAPDSPVAGQANVFIFPDLQSGNIGYKIAQRLGGFEAIGPVLQGLNKPINDLSRGCSKEEAYQLAIITAAQAAL